MGLLDLYKWGLPSQAEHLNRYRDNEPLYNMARSFWNSLDSASIYFFIAFLAIGLALVCFYYYGYNKLPGRKYRIQHWALWLGITAALTIIVTLVLGSAIVSTNLQEKFGFLLRISLINGLYSILVYLVASVVICNIPVPTNAYRFLKIGK